MKRLLIYLTCEKVLADILNYISKYSEDLADILPYWVLPLILLMIYSRFSIPSHSSLGLWSQMMRLKTSGKVSGVEKITFDRRAQFQELCSFLTRVNSGFVKLWIFSLMEGENIFYVTYLWRTFLDKIYCSFKTLCVLIVVRLGHYLKPLACWITVTLDLWATTDRKKRNYVTRSSWIGNRAIIKGKLNFIQPGVY